MPPRTANCASISETHSTAITCSDTFSRTRSVQLWQRLDDGAVVLVVPPGEVALLSPVDARDLAAQLEMLARRLEATMALAWRASAWTPAGRPPTVSDATVWHVLLFVILPMLALVWYGFKKDRWKR
jgi:hypothetical protein